MSCLPVANQLSQWLSIASGVRQGCVIAPDAFVTGMDWLLERSDGRGMNDVTFGQRSFTDLDYVDDVSLHTELLELLVHILEVFRNKLPLWDWK